MTEPEAGPSPVLLDEPAFTALLRWVGPLADDLAGQLALLSDRLRGRLDERQRAQVLAAMERLRMLQIVEQGLAGVSPQLKIVLGSQDLQKQGYARKGQEGVVGPMPGYKDLVDDEDRIWKAIVWIRSVWGGRAEKKTWE